MLYYVTKTNLVLKDVHYTNNIVQFPKKERGIGVSTRMDCLHTKEEIQLVVDELMRKLKYANSKSREKVALRNLTMFMCAIVIGLRGGDFCALKWNNIFDDKWEFLNNPDFVPEKTKRCHRHVKLTWNKDFEKVMRTWLDWKNKNMENYQDLNDYIFDSQKGEGHIQEKSFYRMIEDTRRMAGIPQKIGAHGCRKTMVNRYIKTADNKSDALLEMQEYLGHDNVRTTLRYACLEIESINETKEKMDLFDESMVISRYIGNRGEY